ncbi:DUF4367 domain-containing protein [Paenibacillus sp. 32352]|uniref:DUF4367 domain-containing protein n=1 Tax=Paenibacillus sp. 32352 TaxID=1969111 RepID=UPI0009AD2104|nr:DUF4367 domain-containing protein [Paenibacillus sp. 32352]
MSQAKRHGSFADEMDSYLETGKETAAASEYKPLFELGRVLANRDYSQHSDPETMYHRIMRNKENGKETRGSRKKWTRLAASAASVAAVGIISLSIVQPSFASDIVSRIINTISLGHISVSQMEPSVTHIPIDEMKKQVMVSAQDQAASESNTLVVRDPGQLNQYTSFQVLLPSYQPEGYVFDRAEFYKDEQGVVSGSKYINIYYKQPATGKQIFMQQRHADEETAFGLSTTNKIEAIQIHGVDAVMTGEHSIDWETNGVLYSLTAKGLEKDEVIKIAESIR